MADPDVTEAQHELGGAGAPEALEAPEALGGDAVSITDESAALEAVMRRRRSVRGFLERPVPASTLRAIFELAQTAPSNCNVQPWRVYLASGSTRERVRAALLGVVGGAGGAVEPPRPDFDLGASFQGEYRRHQVECAVALYREIGVERGDAEGRLKAFQRNYALFDAPHVAFIGMDKSFGPSVVVDVGIYLGQLMLLLTAHGIACCPMGSLRNYPDVVRAELGVPEEIGLLVGLCFGYEDPAVPANRARTTRAPVTDNVRFFE